MKILLLHYHPSLAIFFYLYKKSHVHLKPAARVVVTLPLALSAHMETGLEISPHISKDFKIPRFSARQALLLATALCLSIDTAVCSS